MSLCRNINYNQMKVPNLIGHDSVEEVVEEYSKLTRADVQACLNYASRVMGNHFSLVRAA